ncbi:MAG: Hsp70 family protein [Deltaproteobacteria bacterium]|nr:Hsp70 family protein [Deltaproteobacteria bacterium]
MSGKRLIGIDLGTTNTCAAYVEEGTPRVVPTDKGRYLLPSVVGVSPRSAEILVGALAKDQLMVDPANTIYGHKRLIGLPYESPLVSQLRERFTYPIVRGESGLAEVVLGGENRTLAEISAIILERLKMAAQQHLGGLVEQAVITVPAYYNDLQRAAVKQAGELAGLEVVRLVNEPTAAALAYGLDRAYDQRILIYDLGGGTFDISVLQLHGNVFEVVATGGDTFLGGVDFDDRIIDWVVEGFEKEHGVNLREQPAVMQRVRAAAENAKIDLSQVSNVVIELPFVTFHQGKPLDLRVPLSRERLNQLTRDLIDRTFTACDQMLEEQNIDPRSIDEVLLVGGQTRMPVVQGRIHQHFGRPPRKGVHPEEVVAIGGAVLGDSLGREEAVTLIDVLSLPIGFALPDGRFREVLPRNLSLPTTTRLSVSSPRSSTVTVELDLYQGEAERVEQNEFLGTVVYPRATRELIFSLDAEGLLQVSYEQGGQTAVVRLATGDAPQRVRDAVASARESAPSAKPPAAGGGGGLLGSWRKAFGKGE